MDQIPFSQRQYETLIQTRDQQAFLTYSRRFKPQQTKFSHFTIILMGFRRMGILSEGWRFLRKRYDWANEQALTSELNHLSLWMGYWLHIMGATELAARAIANTQPKTPFEVRSVAEILLTQCRYEKASKQFKIYFQMQANLAQEKSYESRLVRLEYADALSGEGYYLEALEVVRKTLGETPEPLLQAIAYSCEVEYWSRLEEYSKALMAAKKAEALMPISDESIDRLLLTKWTSFAEFNINNNHLSYRRLLKCYQSMRKMGLRPEAWLDTLRLLLLCKNNPRSLLRILRYPGIDELLRLKFKDFKSVEGFDPAPQLSLPYSSYSIVIRRNTQEWYYNQQWHYGFNLEIKCVAIITQSGFWGIFRLKLISLLWPDSHPSTLSAMEKRLEQVFQRLRKQWGLAVFTRNQYCFLPATDRRKIHVDLREELQPMIYSVAKKPTPKIIAQFYHLSLSQSYKVAKSLKP